MLYIMNIYINQSNCKMLSDSFCFVARYKKIYASRSLAIVRLVCRR